MQLTIIELSASNGERGKEVLWVLNRTISPRIYITEELCKYCKMYEWYSLLFSITY